MNNERWRYWGDGCTFETPYKSNDPLIEKVLERIESDEELEHVYELLDHVPRTALIEYLITGRDDDALKEELIDTKLITKDEARQSGVDL